MRARRGLLVAGVVSVVAGLVVIFCSWFFFASIGCGEPWPGCTTTWVEWRLTLAGMILIILGFGMFAYLAYGRMKTNIDGAALFVSATVFLVLFIVITAIVFNPMISPYDFIRDSDGDGYTDDVDDYPHDKRRYMPTVLQVEIAWENTSTNYTAKISAVYYILDGWPTDTAIMRLSIIWAPNYYSVTRTETPPAGHAAFVGQPILPGELFQRVLDSQRRDVPPDTLKNLEIGLRLRGYSNIGEGVDWAVSHFYTRLDTPIIDGAEGQSNLVRVLLSGKQRGTIWAYPNYNSTAFTFSTTWNAIKSAIRGECAYNTNRDYNYGKASTNVSSTKEKDLITTALTLDRKTMIPWFSEWNRSRTVDFSFTWYQYWLLNHQHNKRTGEYLIWESGTKDATWTKFTLTASTGFFFDSLITRFNRVPPEDSPPRLGTLPAQE